MAINFPDSPSVDDVFTSGDKTWIWNGSTWTSSSTPIGLDAIGDVSLTSPVTGEVVQYDGTEWVNADVVSSITAAIVDSAPTTLDTLNELAAALGDDPNFATTVTDALAGKAATSHTHTSSQITDLTSNVVSRTNGTVSTASTGSTVVRNITLSTSAPSGGTDGDVWLVYEV